MSVVRIVSAIIGFLFNLAVVGGLAWVVHATISTIARWEVDKHEEERHRPIDVRAQQGTKDELAGRRPRRQPVEEV